MKKRILFVFIVFLSAPTSVHAWSYAEHVSITKSAFEEACLDINFQENLDENGNYKISKYCSKPYQYCYAHMVAMSGDRFSGLESISTTRSITKNKTFSKCLDVLSSNTANINLDKKIKTFESKAAPDSKDR